MDFSSPLPQQKKPVKQHAPLHDISSSVDDEFVDELRRVALEQHKQHHKKEHDGVDLADVELHVVQNSFDQIEGELSGLLQEEESRKIEESPEYQRVTEHTAMGGYGAGLEAGGSEYGASSHGHGASATFEANCCGERIVVQSTPSGKIKATNLSEQVKQYQEAQTGGAEGGYGASQSGYESGGGESGAFRGYQ